MGKKQRRFETIAKYKERFSDLTIEKLKQRLSNGSLYKEAAIAIRELLEEKSSEKLMEHKIPRQYSLVSFDFSSMPSEWHEKYPFKPEGVYVYFGEIPNMKGHCVVADHKTGQIYSGYHIDNFVELDEDEA